MMKKHHHMSKADGSWDCSHRGPLALPKRSQCQLCCNSLRPVAPNWMSLQWSTGREIKRILILHPGSS